MSLSFGTWSNSDVRALGVSLTMSSKVKSRPLRISADFGRVAASEDRTISMSSRSILLMMSAMRACGSAPALREKFLMKSSWMVFSITLHGGVDDGLEGEHAAHQAVALVRGDVAHHLGAHEGRTLERMSAAVCGCSFMM